MRRRNKRAATFGYAYAVRFHSGSANAKLIVCNKGRYDASWTNWVPWHEWKGRFS